MSQKNSLDLTVLQRALVLTRLSYRKPVVFAPRVRVHREIPEDLRLIPAPPAEEPPASAANADEGDRFGEEAPPEALCIAIFLPDAAEQVVVDEDEDLDLVDGADDEGVLREELLPWSPE